MSRKEELEAKFETINFFIDEVITEMKTINNSNTKKDLLAYISAWEDTLQTIKFMIN